MPHQLLSPADKQAIHQCRCPSVAQLQRASRGTEGQQAGHPVSHTLGVAQLLPKQQHAATFRHHWKPYGVGGLERCQGALAARQLGCMQFRITTRQHHSSGVRGQRVIGQGAPGSRDQPTGLQQFGRFWVAKVKGCVAGHSDGKRLGSFLLDRLLVPVC